MKLFDSPRSRIILGSFLQLAGASDSLRARLVKSAGGTFALKITATGLGFLTTLLLARVLGATGYGAYAYAIAWLGFLSLSATLGFHQLLVRDVAIYRMQEEWGLLRGLLSVSKWLVLAVSIVLMVVAALAGWMLLGSTEKNSMLLTFLVALLALPFSALTQIRQAAMRGFQQIIRGQLPELLIRPALFLAMFAGTAFLFRQHLSAHLAVALNVIAIIIAYAIGFYWLNKVQPIDIKMANSRFRTRAWLAGALPLMVVTGIQLINFQVDVIFLGVYQNAGQVGIYVVSKQLAGLLAFGLFAVEISIAPSIATLYTMGETSKLQRMISKGIAVLIGVSLPIVFLLAFFGEHILLLFGPEFVSGFPALMILGVGQLINVSLGPIGQIAIHTGHERGTATITGLTAILNVFLNMLLIPEWGVIGAAVATTTSMACWNVVLAIYIYRKTGIISCPIGFFRKMLRMEIL